MRTYLPATLDELDGSTDLAPRRGYAVTAALRAALPDEDEEGWEFAAHLAAADDSLVLLARRPDAPALRLVVTADLDDAAVRVLDVPPPGADAGDVGTPGEVEVTAPVAWSRVACVHVDEPATASDVRAALAGDDAAVERLEEADLLWYDVSELRDIPRA
ncbi:hypothetical protein KIN34_10180 [Cellulomonas sp. DKR-3]|uniref:Suppressor of fused-like domain-containing protein n=1 Tax=Cellulomonas fulva TaxID=2835530 RepID=A0ABS5TZR3_9CELL|nr:hypothetical protein [Cellulomonas fulva]MBT0994654.1 hypothetical protein [Cellulomonas fulva]